MRRIPAAETALKELFGMIGGSAREDDPPTPVEVELSLCENKGKIEMRPPKK